MIETYEYKKHFPALEEPIKRALEGFPVELKISSTPYTEHSFYVIIRHVLRYAEEVEGMLGARALKVRREGEGDERVLILEQSTDTLEGLIWNHSTIETLRFLSPEGQKAVLKFAADELEREVLRR